MPRGEGGGQRVLPGRLKSPGWRRRHYRKSLNSGLKKTLKGERAWGGGCAVDFRGLFWTERGNLFEMQIFKKTKELRRERTSWGERKKRGGSPGYVF